MALLCEECDESLAAKYCASCEQKLCSECDIRIHNKGKRAQHLRGDLAPQKQEYLAAPKSRATLPQAEVYNQGDLRISVFQQLNFSDEVMGPKEIAKIGMGSFLAVAKGSEEPARFIVMQYQGAAGSEGESQVLQQGASVHGCDSHWVKEQRR